MAGRGKGPHLIPPEVAATMVPDRAAAESGQQAQKHWRQQIQQMAQHPDLPALARNLIAARLTNAQVPSLPIAHEHSSPLFPYFRPLAALRACSNAQGAAPRQPTVPCAHHIGHHTLRSG